MYLSLFGNFTLRGKVLTASKVCCFNEQGETIDLPVEAGDYLREMGEFLDRLELQGKAAEEFKRAIRPTDACLQRVMETEGITEDVLSSIQRKTRVELGPCQGSLNRHRTRFKLQFPVLSQRTKSKRKLLHFPEGTPVKLFTYIDQNWKEIDFTDPKQSNKSNTQVRITHTELEESVPISVTLSFPRNFDPACIKDAKLAMQADIIPPGELAQRKELQRWLQPEFRLPFERSLIADGAKWQRHEPEKFHDPYLAGNPRQKDALAAILGDSPLQLIKGPPGTGKTTLIVEAIQHLIADGQKVLVCSETHQAVANVLERLHEKNVPMLRHGREDHPRISKLERCYLTDRVESEEFSKSLQKITINLRERTRFITTADQALPILDNAITISESIEQKKLEIQEKKNDILEQAALDLGQVLTKHTRLRNEEENRARTEEKPLQKGLSKTDSELGKYRKKNKSLEKILTSLEKTYQRHHGESTSGKIPSTVGEKRSVLKRLVPKRFAGEKELAHRVSNERNKLQECATQSDNLEKELRSIKQLLADMKSAHLQTMKDLGEQEEVEKGNIETSKQNKLNEEEALKLKFYEERLPTLLKAAQLYSDTYKEAPPPTDQSPEEWDHLHRKLSEDLETQKKEKKFLERWKVALEANPSAHNKTLWDTTSVFLSTCVGLASWKPFTERFGKEGVDVVIVDEAAHATLNQALIPLGRAQRVVLIGDEMQLPPSAPMELAKSCAGGCQGHSPNTTEKIQPLAPTFQPKMSECWMERSAFEWIQKAYPNVPRVMLDRQFRMHPDIGDFISDVFYEGKLQTGVSAADRTLHFGDFQKAVCLVSTSAYNDRYESKPRSGLMGYENALEGAIILRILEDALKAFPSENPSCGVITPYKAQRELLLGMLAPVMNQTTGLNLGVEHVASVDSFQGSERDVMIASFVRSPKKEPFKCPKCKKEGYSSECPECKGRGWIGPRLDWVHDLRRLNVAFSRARKMLILVGDIDALSDNRFNAAQGADVLNRFKEHVYDRGKTLQVWERAAS